MATNYTAGDLNVSILGDSIQAEKGIDNVIRKLKSLQKTLTLFSEINAKSVGTNLSKTFTQISTAINSIDISNIDKLTNLNTAINPLKNFINTIKNVKSQEIYGKMSGLFRGLSSSVGFIDDNVSLKLQSLGNATASFRTFINAINRVGKIDATQISTNLTTIFTALSTSVNSIDDATLAKLEKVGLSAQGLTALKGSTVATSSNSKKGGFPLLNLMRWTTVLYLARRLGQAVANIVKKGADYTETLNLWEVAMKGNNDQATEFVNKMNEAYGISKKTLMNAQATFKNMLGSLGDITDAMAYQLSEGVTQMAVDYASLYNVKFEQAFTKFQAALAGQVRPIRSISGYDITENTLYQLYQSLGGTKTIRQLSITEKRLLSILAIFKQMQGSGAIGDLGKTMETYANQSRVMAESWQEVLTFSGLIITHWLETFGVMEKINGILIFMGDVLEAVAINMGAIKSFGGEAFGDIENSALGAVKAVDELNGKLLGFDKFRVMNTQEENPTKIDETLAKAIASYDTVLSNATLKAKEFAEYLKQSSGLFDENGIFNPEKWEEIATSIKNWGSAIKNSFDSPVLKLLLNFIDQILNPLGYSLDTIPELLISFADTLNQFFNFSFKLATPFFYVIEAIVKVVSTLLTLLYSLFSFDFKDLGNNLKNIWSNWGTTDILKGLSPKEYAVGASNIDSGTMFIAGESGKTEAVFNGNNGRTNVANIQQMKSAFYQALVEYGKTQNNSQPIVVAIDGQEVFYATRKVANQNGLDFSNVR